MTDRSDTRPRRSSPPLWLVEGLDIAQQRRPMLLSVIAVTVVIGLVLAATAPGLVPPVPLVGAAVGFAALLLGMAAAVALDATDLRLRGPRHVGAAGGELVAVLPVDASVEAAGPLATAVLDAREDGAPLLLGLAAAGRDVRHTAAWTDALGRALVAEDVSVLCIDLASGRSEPPGLVEVVRDGVKLTQAVRFEPGARLARIGAGGDHAGALASLTTLPSRLPRDLDVLLVSLPTAASRPVVEAVRALDHVLIVAERDETSRVDLIAGLDALDSAGTRAQVALLDDPTAHRMAPRSPAAARVADVNDGEAEDRDAGDGVAEDGVAEDRGAGDGVAEDGVVVGRVVEDGDAGGQADPAAEDLGQRGGTDPRPGPDQAAPGPGSDDASEGSVAAPVPQDADEPATRPVRQFDSGLLDPQVGGPTQVADGPANPEAEAGPPRPDASATANVDAVDDVPDAGASQDVDEHGEPMAAMPAIGGPAPDRHRPAVAGPDDARADGGEVRRREVEVLLGAAEAAAIALTASEQRDPPDLGEDQGPRAPSTRAPAVPATPTPVDLGDETYRTGSEQDPGSRSEHVPTAGDRGGAGQPSPTGEHRAAAPAPSTEHDRAAAPAPSTDEGATTPGASPPGDSGTDPTSSSGRSNDGERTDELPRSDGALRGADEQQEEMLHTTARLSILLEDLEQRPGEDDGGRA